MHFRTPTLLAALIAFPLRAAEPTPENLEFFEKTVRPLLIEHCYACHSDKIKNPKGGLRVDSRQALLEGGDSGPAVVPGDPAKSKFVTAITYKDVDLQMPPKAKLSQKEIDDLTKWVSLGVPWPAEAKANEGKKEGFDLAQRKHSHWAWKPIEVKKLTVTDDAWAASEIDRYLLAKLRDKNLTPAPEADRPTLIRRLYFDLIGLPPRPDEIDDFLNDASPIAWEKVIDRLLESPRFGERWGRHWLDLVRYAESRGHEFDPNIPNAWQYRDYVIRALNQDVPFDRFVREHLAGDLLKEPRLNPTEGFDESVLGTGFWFLGEEVHSPVDTRADQADRFDNRIDVFSKTFLGLTVSCARCHDHKFDAITTKDYYSLFGYLESTNARLVRFDSLRQNREIAVKLRQLRDEHRKPLQQALAEAWRPEIERMADYLLEARQTILEPKPNAKQRAAAKNLDANRLDAWITVLRRSASQETDPLHGFALTALERDEAEAVRKLKSKLDRWKGPTPSPSPSDVVIDYAHCKPNEFLPDDTLFGLAPTNVGDLRFGTDAENPVTGFVEFAAAETDPIWNGLRISPESQQESSSLGGFVRPGRTIRTPSFELKTGRVFALLKGRGNVYGAIDQHVMIAGPLHGGLIHSFDTGDKWQWIGFDWSVYKGHRLHLEFTPVGDRAFAIRSVVQADQPPPLPETIPLLPVWEKSASVKELAAGIESTFRNALNRLRDDQLEDSSDAALLNWLLHHPELARGDRTALQKASEAYAGEQAKLIAQIRWDSRLALAMQEGSGVEERIFIRGSHKALGEVAPRRLPEALVGNQTSTSSGSGRLELADQLLDPKVNPFLSRVAVNRVWHHLTGRGIVASVDNFGVLGELPTHPELLDYLAQTFVDDGWSMKKLIRRVVSSKFYRMSSTPTPEGQERDIENLLLHRMRVRRLEGEAIRDSILSLSGRLDSKQYGVSVPLHLTDFLEGRGRPSVSGPLDGDGRRSVYVAVRRNFLSPMMLAFDTPSPFSTVGKRTVSNVPAQALILLNDPFVHQQAQLWARRVLSNPDDATHRIRLMYRSAFAREPTSDELQKAESFIAGQRNSNKGDESVWADFAHVLMNVKEFIFVK